MPSLACYTQFLGCFLDLSFGIGYIRCFNQMANIFLNCIQIPPSAFDFSIYFNTVINIFMIEGYSLQLDESYEKIEWQKPKKRPIQSPASHIFVPHILHSQDQLHFRCFNQMASIFIICIGIPSPLQSSKVQDI